jgi:uncharacterized protein YjbI with pentapeptide repeats
MGRLSRGSCPLRRFFDILRRVTGEQMDHEEGKTATKEADRSTPEHPGESTARLELEEILERHGAWLESGGSTGRRADLSRAHLEGADLTDANLRSAILDHTVLNAADMLLADLQGASLIQADLQFANLLGTKFRHANLQGATLEQATGLLSSQLAGANLIGAALPTQPPTFEGLKHVAALARWANWLIIAMVFLNGLAWLRIFTTTDLRLLQNAPAVPLPGFQTILPLVPLYLFGPIAILGLYVCFHFYLQRLWDVAAALPAIFPDGRRLDAALPWFARWPARRYFRWLEEQNHPHSQLERALSFFLLYWMVPTTIFLFWGRYLTLQDVRGTTLQGLMVVGALAGALYFPRMVASAFGAEALQSANSALVAPGAKSLVGLVRRSAPLAGAALLLFLLSAGIILGGPRDSRHPVETQTWGPSTWAARALWLAGYNPYAQLTESDISAKPANWVGRDDQIALVKGANLNNLRLRYAQAYGAFFVKARLWQANLQNAYLSEADLRQANLHQASLRGAVLDRALMNHAILTEADLQKSDATQADLRDADLSHASLVGAILIDAKLDGASLYGADLREASLERASLPKADLREAILGGADFAEGNLEEAYLSSAKMYGANLERTQLRQAILTDADLRNADLRDADLQGSILNGADLSGAILQGADLRGAQGVTATQLCSASIIGGTQLDDALESGVQSQCAGHR